MYNTNPRTYYPYNDNDDRFIGGGFAAPFLLGGLTASLLTPYRPYYPPYAPYYPPYYAPYYYPRYPRYPRYYY